MKSIYLAGPITGKSYEEAAKGWRQQFAKWIDETNFKSEPQILCYSPMRGKEFLQGEKKLPDQGYENVPMSTARAIIGRDFQDVKNADLIVCNLSECTCVSIGSMMELAWAYALQKPVLLIRDPKNIHTTHAWIKETVTWEVDNLPEAVHIANVFLKP